MFKKKRRHMIDPSWVPALNEMLEFLINKNYEEMEKCGYISVGDGRFIEEEIGPVLSSIALLEDFPKNDAFVLQLQNSEEWEIDFELWSSNGPAGWRLKVGFSFDSNG